MSRTYVANLLGALALILSDEVSASVEKSLGLGGSAPAALVTIRNQPGQSIDSLCKSLGLSHSGTVRLVDRLVAAGFVERQAGNDGRSLALFLTQPGEDICTRVLAARDRTLLEALSVLENQEVAQFQELLEKLAQTLPRDREALQACRLCDFSVCPGDLCPIGKALSSRLS